MKQVKTGIAGFDWFLKGGLPPKVILLSGAPGSGNEIFVRQVAYNLAKENKISYFTVHSSSEYVKEDMLAYGWNVDELEKTGNWRFLCTPKGEKFIDAVLEEIKQDRMVFVDSLSELLLIHKIEDVIKLVTEMSLYNKNRSSFHMVLLTEGMQTSQTETMMEHFAEGVISLDSTRTGDTTLRHILVKKLRGTTVPGRRLQYNLKQTGLVIETATRIN